jgi:NodT family efflux transporter outer membrane factor (OMF) lipoprotein
MSAACCPRARRSTMLAVALCLSGCAVGPNYHRPTAAVPEAYKELPKDAPVWTPAAPQDGANRGAWWSIYADAELDRLERQVNISNQNVKQFEAEYRQAVGLLDEARAQLFPVIAANGTATRGGGGGGTASTSSAVGSGPGGRTINQFRLEATVNWTPDIWGTVRRQIESRKAAVQVSKADLANAQLSAQATLAADYFDLRAADSLRALLVKNVELDRRALEITQNQFKGGLTTDADVAEAQALLQSTQAQLIGVEQQRGTFEHAIAMLAGRLPSEVDVSEAPLAASVPDIPVVVPSSLLQRNPSIAAAERQMQQESALIGVAVGAYFPTVTLSGLGGYAGSQVSRLINLGNRIWSVGASASDTLLDFGARAGAVTAARATYDQYVAMYRQTVLSTFQQVEDELLALRVLQDEEQYEDQAVNSAQRAADVALNEYNAGTVAYTTVITALQTLITAQQTALTIHQNRLVASVTLIEALGGGWTSAGL